MHQNPHPDSDSTDRIVVSYPADLSEWGRSRLEQPSFRAWLVKTHERATPGDLWEEFVDIGCCGSSLDVSLRVERVEGGQKIDEETVIEYDVRDACGIEGGWQVQSEDGPSRV